MGIFGVIWALLGVSCLLLNAIIRLAPRGWEALEMDLSNFQWVAMIVFTLFMLVAEGYRGFQKKFSPRTAARIRYLRGNPTIVRLLFAPIFAMGFFQSNKKTKIVVWVITTMIICLIIAVGSLSQPWRGIIDIGVVLGLSYGLISFWIYAFKALTQKEFNHSAELG